MIIKWLNFFEPQKKVQFGLSFWREGAGQFLLGSNLVTCLH